MEGSCSIPGMAGKAQVHQGCHVLLGQQAHEVGGGVGVQPQGWHGDIGGGVGPILVVVVQACQRGVGSGGLGQHNLPWRRKKSPKHQQATKPSGNLGLSLSSLQVKG